MYVKELLVYALSRLWRLVDTTIWSPYI